MRPQYGLMAALMLAMGCLIAWGTPAQLHAQQGGTVTGTVLGAQGQTLSGVQITVVGTQRGTLTDAQGVYTIREVPAGTREVRVQFIGYTTVSETVTVVEGESVTLDFQLQQTVLDLGEIIVTGVAGEMERAKLPFTVDRLSADDLPVSRLNVASAIQGKVAGAQVVHASGRPGSAPSILLRGATSISASGRSQDPLYIVDGVILSASVVDIDALDIENIEVVKGAAAASLYGSRAAAGVIQITTQRGQGIADGQVRYTLRSDLGVSDLPGEFPILQRHFWALTDDGSMFIDDDGTPCTFRGTPSWDPNNECSGVLREAGQRAGADGPDQWNSFATNPWPDGTFDQVDRFFDGGLFQEHYISASGRQGATNFHTSFSRLHDEGPLLGRQGNIRNSFRVNVDQMVNPDIHIQASAYYARSKQDMTEGTIFDLTRMMPGVDLTMCEPIRRDDGTYQRRDGSCLNDPENLLLNVNPTNEESANPLYPMLVWDRDETRGRFLASSNISYSLTDWIDLEADVSFDRLDRERWSMNPKGYRTLTPSLANEGALSLNNLVSESLNTSVTATFRRDLTDNITNRTRLRYLYEQEDQMFTSVGGNEFAVRNVPRINNLNPDRVSGSSSQQTVLADGYFVISSFDMYDRYVLDVLVRNDGSSLFGADERRHWYYRVGGSWLMGREAWFDYPSINEFKLRYSRGTAGGRPSFTAQYETFSVAAGAITPVNLGNRNLKPEHSVEDEVGLDVSFLNRFAASLTHARTETDNQIMTVPLPAFTGFSSQVQNVGILESQTWEASFDAVMIQRPDFQWSARILYDQTRSTITELNRPDFRYGVGGQGMGNVFFAREGEQLGTFYGVRYARGCDDLPTDMSCDGFAVNDDGYLVWVGDGGLAANAWGTSSGDVQVRGSSLDWGTPFQGECTDRATGERELLCRVGNTSPDYTVSLSSTVNWRGFSIYGLAEAVQGFDVYNQPLQWALFRRNIDEMNQADVPEDQRKPIGYYDALYGVSGLTPSNVFVEDASFVKLRELSVRYRLGADQLQGVPGLANFSGLGLTATGRNLYTSSDYRGYDPEVGAPGGSTGSAAVARVDGYRYPNFRTWTFGIELIF